MSENGMNYLELKYEHLYNMRDQTLLFEDVLEDHGAGRRDTDMARSEGQDAW